MFDAFNRFMAGSLPKGLKEKVTCSRCGDTFYTLDNPTMEEQLALRNMGYRAAAVYYHDVCGKYTCDSCLQAFFFASACKCGKKGTMYGVSAVRKR